MRTFLYVLGVNFTQKGKYFVKIGISKEIKTRIKELQTGCPARIKPIRACEIPKVGSIKREKQLHTMLSEFKSHGEWFELNEKSHDLIHKYFFELMYLVIAIAPIVLVLQ